MTNTRKTYETRWSDSNGQAWDVVLTMSSGQGREELIAIRVSSTSKRHPLTQSVVRSVPVLEMLRNITTEGSPQATKRIVGRWTPQSRLSIRDNRELVLQTVARTYNSAFKSHLPVQKTVAQRLNVPLSTATRYIALARKFGYLTDNPRLRPTAQTGSRRHDEQHKPRIQD
jgi:hypothetical protein